MWKLFKIILIVVLIIIVLGIAFLVLFYSSLILGIINGISGAKL